MPYGPNRRFYAFTSSSSSTKPSKVLKRQKSTKTPKELARVCFLYTTIPIQFFGSKALIIANAKTAVGLAVAEACLESNELVRSRRQTPARKSGSRTPPGQGARTLPAQ